MNDELKRYIETRIAELNKRRQLFSKDSVSWYETTSAIEELKYILDNY